MERVATGRWRTFEHARSTDNCYACCQIIDRRTNVIHLIPLEKHQYYTARMRTTIVDPRSVNMALWPTASSKQREQLPLLLTQYLCNVRGDEFPEPSADRKMISLSVYADGTLSWPAITQLTKESNALPC